MKKPSQMPQRNTVLPTARAAVAEAQAQGRELEPVPLATVEDIIEKE